MHFTGEERFSLDSQTLWERLADFEFLARTLPGVQRVESVGPETLVCRVKPDFSFLKGTLKLTLEMVDQQPPESARVRVFGKGIGTSLLVETAYNLSRDGSHTKLCWQSDVKEMRGMLKAVSRGLIEAAAMKVIAQAWVNLRNELETP